MVNCYVILDAFDLFSGVSTTSSPHSEQKNVGFL